ncbi:MAG: Adaptive-response sensory-kinase SasA [Bryobacteraceae bacterium]|nr:Adaptive-response sensory-kinase SasA [Bryobacteraceae bacterium]
MRFPRIVAAQRLQTWLLITALVAMFVAALLVVDLARNLRTVVISDSTKALTNAVKELAQSGRAWQSGRGATPPDNLTDRQLSDASYDVLRSYPDIEGGYMLDGVVYGHTFPTYTEPGSTLRQAPLEAREVGASIAISRGTGRVVTRVLHDGRDLVLLAAYADPAHPLSAWCLRRLFNFSESNELNQRILLVAAMIVALAAILFVLRLSFGLQRGFEVIQSGLQRLRADPGYRLPDQEHELEPIVTAINQMADGRQVAESELRREDRLRVMGRVVAGIAHEIRNPLNSIRLTARVLARRLHDEPSAAEPVSLIIAEIDRLDSLLKSLLVFRAHEAAKARLQPVEPILARTIALVKPHAEDSGVTIALQSLPECTAWVDGDYLQQALINLLLNAIDASGPRGTVEITVTRTRHALSLGIDDSGPGLTPEQQDRAFEAFYTTKTGGTGLGLAVTKALLEKMGASIRSGNGARGARFEVLLPLDQAA